MTTDDILRMAREAGLAEWHESIQQDGFRFADPDRLARFAALVAAAERTRMISEGWRQCAQGQRTSQWCAQAEDRLARHGIPMPDEDDHDGNPSF